MNNKINIINREKQRALAKGENRDSFIGRNYWLWVMVAFVAYPLASILSAFTEGSNIYFRMSAMGVNIFFVGLAVFIVVALIETLSYTLGKGMIDDMQAGIFSGDSSDIGMFAVKVIGFIAIMSFSVFLSINGAPLLNEKMRESYVPASASFINVDSINTAYNAAILPHQENITRMQKTTWKGSITRDANRSIMQSQKLIAQLEDRRTAELSSATGKNDTTLSDWESETATNSGYAMGFAGLGEIIKLFCLIFIGIYDQGLSKEAAVFGGSTKVGQKQQQNIGFQNNAHRQAAQANQYDYEDKMAEPTPTPRNPIGFRRPCVVEPVEADTSHNNANEWPQVATAKEVYEMELDVLELAYKHAKASYHKWTTKEANGAGTTETNMKHAHKWEEFMKVIDERMKSIQS